MKHCTTRKIKDMAIFYLSNYDNLNRTLDEEYKTYSRQKENAFEYCINLVNKYYGYKPRILGSNTSKFSFGFIGLIENEKTGKQESAFFYITKSYDRYILLKEID